MDMSLKEMYRGWLPYMAVLLAGLLVVAVPLLLLNRNSGGGTEELAVATQTQLPVLAEGRAEALYETQCVEYIDEGLIGRGAAFTHSFLVSDVAVCVYEDCATGRWDCGAWTADDWYGVMAWALPYCADLREGGWKHECWEGGTETSRLLLDKLADDKTPAGAETTEGPA